MPELPEVETVKETLKHLIIGKTIEETIVSWPRIIKKPEDRSLFQATLRGQTFQDIERRGKFIRFILSEYVLVSHLRMEGRYSVEDADAEPDKHTHVIFQFTDGVQLFYRDVRKFGTMHLFLKGEEWKHPPLAHLGPEPLESDFNEGLLKQAFAHTERIIKAVLLDQHVLVGLGNIYVDESLFRAGIHPNRVAKSLSDDEIERLVESIRATLSEAVEKGGSSVRTYLNGQGRMGMFQHSLFVYDRKGAPCKQCEASIEKIKIAGRGTHYCPVCQRR